MTDQIHTITMSEEAQSAFESGRKIGFNEGVKAAYDAAEQYPEVEYGDGYRDAFRHGCMAARDAIRALSMPAPTQGWQTIDSAPKDGTEIILFFPSYHEEKVQVMRWDDAGEFWNGIDGFQYPDGEDAPTHWFPLIALPQTPEGV